MIMTEVVKVALCEQPHSLVKYELISSLERVSQKETTEEAAAHSYVVPRDIFAEKRLHIHLDRHFYHLKIEKFAKPFWERFYRQVQCFLATSPAGSAVVEVIVELSLRFEKQVSGRLLAKEFQVVLREVAFPLNLA